ncbi:MAG: DJ-1/PfpI family protein, partial [Myxococcota bacterium]
QAGHAMLATIRDRVRKRNGAGLERATILEAKRSAAFDTDFGGGSFADRLVGLVDDALAANRGPRGMKLLIDFGSNRGVDVIEDEIGRRHPLRMPNPSSPRSIVMVVYPGVQLLDVVGPLEVFAAADEAVAPGANAARAYALTIVGSEPGAARASSGLSIGVDRAYEDLPSEIDTLIVAGGHGTARAFVDPRVVEAVRAGAARARRTCSVCTGAFVLAAAGLLDGRRATTHWGSAPALARLFPTVDVDPDPIFVRDGDVWTSAGVTAGMDLALALVEDDLGRELALEVSRRMVFFLKRPGGQSQFSAQLEGQVPDRDPLRALQTFIVEHPAEDHAVERLAARVSMSPRNFSRVFAKQVGQSPGRFVERVRVEAARRRLEETVGTVDAVASDVGFGTAETMRRAFLRQIGVGPAAYRERFNGTP